MRQESIGRHRIVQKLGAGGMGEVFLAEDTLLGRRVAIKLVRPDIVLDAQAHARFLREARALAGLTHPNIAVLYEVGDFEGRPFLVMEYIDGHSLKDELMRGPLPSARLVDLAAQICAAIGHAHQHGVLHRDIKSSNILLTRDSAAKVCDFGLAKFLEAPEETQSQLTATGTWVGTLHYSPPEVITGQPADPRSDLYSLGVVLYEMACGHLPCEGLDGTALVAAILYGNLTPLGQRNPTVPATLERAIHKAMARRPEDRFAIAAELAAALKEASTPASTAVTAGTPASEEPMLAVLEFENVSGDPASDWLGTGLAETLTTDLQKLKLVRVVSRERVQAALRSRGAGTKPDAGLAEIGRELGARWLIAGSFQRAGGRLRITPRVVETATGEVLATAKVDGNWDDIFDLQDRVVANVMEALQVKVDSSALERIAAPETLHLEAYQLYAEGRKKFHELGKDSLEQARQCFEKAIALDARYQVAYSALGSTHAMRYIHRTDPDDLAKAASYLQRAIELDPELAEPYPWLCYVYMRQGKPEQAIAAGKKGAELQPDNYIAHYFLGAGYIVGAEVDPVHLVPAVESLCRATIAEPRWEFSWLCLGWLALVFGAYDEAERILLHADGLERDGKTIDRVVGVQTVLGSTWLRRGDPARAREWYERSLERLATIDHMYREAFVALTHCGLGDRALRSGDIAGAQAAYRRASNTVKEFPRMLGNERVLARATSGLAAAYAAAGERTRAQELVLEADTLLASVRGKPQTWIWEASASLLHYAQAAALARLGDADAALGELEKTVANGWRDAAWLVNDPEMAPLRSLPRYQNLLEAVRSAPQATFSYAQG